MPFIMALCMNLKRLRRQEGMTQQVLARQAKMTQPYLAMLENGSFRNPTLDVLRRLAKALNVTVAELVK